MDNKKAIFGWTMYDWASSAFTTTIMAAVLPVFYYSVAFKGHDQTMASSFWGYSNSIAMLIVALLAPIMGAIADYSSSKKKFLRFFTYMGVITSILLGFVGEGDYLLASILLIIGTIAFSSGNVFYDSFLPGITTKENIDTVSTRGYAFGYIGGGILLAINLAMIQMPELFGLNTLLATQLSFVSVGIWWFLFSIPIFKHVPEHKNAVIKQEGSYVKIGFSRLGGTFKEINQYKQLLKFLFAFWLYNDGISTIIKMATIYGADIGIGTTHLIAALLITQFVGIPCTFFFGGLAKKIGAKSALYITLWAYVIILALGYFMTNATHFYLLAVAVGLVQGGAQALSRSIFGTMVPENKHAEFYGFYGVMGKFSAIFGPFLFALVGQLTGSSRFAIVSLVIFFIAGIFLLSRVDVEKGQQEAKGTNIAI